MTNTKTLQVPHLWGTTVAYQMPRAYQPTLPTVVLINSFTMTSDLYAAQFKNESLLSAMNMIAIEPLGHGQTRTTTNTFTYWDSAIIALQALDALEIGGKVFALGTSQGGWIVVRMALLQPDRMAGILPLGTSMDYESQRTRNLGNFDCISTLTGPIQDFTEPDPDFIIPQSFRDFPIYCGFGKDVDDETVRYWNAVMQHNYNGLEGQRRLREATVNLRDRDGLHGRLAEVKCPVLWLHGTDDAAYGTANAKEEIRLFVNSANAQLQVVEGGQHYLSASHPDIVDKALLDFVKKYS